MPTPIKYSAEELDWIKARSTWPRAKLHAVFQKTFNRGDVSLDNLKSLCTRNGWGTGRDGRYAPGSTPANKGKKVTPHPNSVKTQFKKGVVQGRAKLISKPVGYERISKDGYLERKINNDRPFYKRWAFVHRLNWEAKNGPVPAGYFLKCLDSNKLNVDPDNWIALPKSMQPRLSGVRHSLSYDEADPDVKETLLAAARLEQAARALKSKGKK